MGKHSDVKIVGSGLPPGTPVGVTITYQVGGIPTAAVDIVPPAGGGGKIVSASFGNIDALKRKGEAAVWVEVKTHSGAAGTTQRNLAFKGLLDGMSLSNMVGGNHYQAILKNKAQRLLELTTYMPGLLPSSTNIYKQVDHAVIVDSQGGDEGPGSVVWGMLAETRSFAQDPVGFYTDLMKLIIKKQKGGWDQLMGGEATLSGDIPFKKIFEDKRYQAALTQAEEFFSNIDLSAVSGGTLGSSTLDTDIIHSQVRSQFIQGSNVLLENYMGFIASLNCSLIFSNSKIYVVPQNSVIKQANKAPGRGQMQNSPNTAGPADYNSYSYNDSGYRDIAMVIISAANSVGGNYAADRFFETGGFSYFAEKEDLSQASGVLAFNAHPWMTITTFAPSPADAKEATQDLDDPSKSMMDKKKRYTDTVKDVGKKHAERSKKKSQKTITSVKDVLDNFAATKFYQSRYQDRHGSITMDFNPNWAPGTGGSLFVRETQTFINFYVTSVTHRIEHSAPNNGTALTIVNFNCGRIGSDPAGTSEDKFLGYNLGAEQKIQKGFIEDNK